MVGTLTMKSQFVALAEANIESGAGIGAGDLGWNVLRTIPEDAYRGITPSDSNRGE